MSSLDAKIDGLVTASIDLGRERFYRELNERHTPFLVPHDHAGEVLRLLIDAGYSLSNSREWGGFVCRKP